MGSGFVQVTAYDDRDRTSRTPVRSARTAAIALVMAVITGCGQVPPDPAPTTPTGPGPSSPVTTPAAPSSTPPTSPPPTRASSPPTPTSGPTASPTARPAPPTLRGDPRNGWAYAALDDPDDITVEGGVRTGPAWSTSKVLIVAAFLDTVADGDPRRLSAADRGLIRRSLTASDGVAVNRLRDRIPGSSGAAMTRVLRSIGDETTVAPDSYQGLMPWSLREQVRFATAMARGRVVSRPASAYLRRTMQPIRSQAWGLGTIDAEAFKGGWLRGDTVTRQFGIVDGYAVAVITAGVGPAVVQSDGDAAHVRQLDRLAARLERRLDHERTSG